MVSKDSSYMGSRRERVLTYSGPQYVDYRTDVGRGHVVDFTPIIRHPKTRRLKEIGQLSPVDLVINDADHKRYTHVLGTFYIGQQIVERSILYPDEIQMDEADRFIFLSICLLHDIGHGPNSHVYEIIADAYGMPDHKTVGASIIRNELRGAIKQAANGNFKRVDLPEEIAGEIENKGSLSRLACDKDRPDKLDYVFRDAEHCRLGAKPDIHEIAENIIFDGEKSGVKAEAKDALRGFMEAIVTNNKMIYLLGEVEIVEGFLIRAACYRIDNAFEYGIGSGFDPMRGYSMTDSEFNEELQKHPVSKRLVSSIKNRDARDWVAVSYIKPEGYRRAAEAEMNRLEVEKTEIEEASDSQLSFLSEILKLPKLLPFEKRIRQELGLEPEEFEITTSPQIDRLVIKESNVATKENGRYTFENIVAPGTTLAADLTDRLKEHHAIRIVTTREKAKKVLDYVKVNGGPKKLLLEQA